MKPQQLHLYYGTTVADEIIRRLSIYKPSMKKIEGISINEELKKYNYERT